MKKHLLLLTTFVAGAMGMNAQITITTADVVVPNKLIYQSIDTVPTVSAGSAGTSQTWNMSTLQTMTVDTMNFISPSWTGDVTSFPSANLAIQIGYAPQYGYALNSSTGLTALGNRAEIDFGGSCGGPSVIRQYNTPAEILINFPANYSSSFNNNFVSDATFCFGLDPGIGFVVDSARQKSVVSKTNTCDAWGNITTPLGTFATLRFYEVRYQTDSLFGYISGFGWTFFQETVDSSKKYIWWANSVGFPIVETEVDWTTGAVTRAQWLQALPVTGVNEYASATPVLVYPNPAQDVLNIHLDASKVGSIRIYDIAGRMIEELNVRTDQETINTSKYSNGMYTYSVLGKKNEHLNRGKFTVAK